MRNYPWSELLLLFLCSCLLKLLLVTAYFSTDFDVHQNWLRITSTLPLSQWYHDSLSKWTLDYPPLFAYFEWLLAQFANSIDPSISATLNTASNTILFQRISVILSEIPLLLALYYVIGRINGKLVIAYLWLPFIVLDNIHFQYNIIMQALLILSVHSILNQKYLQGALLYSVLLNFKHIYLYASLAFFAYLLKKYVLAPEKNTEKIKHLCKLAVVTLLPFVVSFGPFLIVGGFSELGQILSRLFPFQRGLIHEYWAPNFWALYYFADKLANLTIGRYLPAQVSFQEVGNDLHHLKILPQPTPFLTIAIILTVTLPLLLLLIKKQIPFSRLVLVCGLVFFFFGYHVHQKAITPYIHLMFVFLYDPLSKTKQSKKISAKLLNSAIFVNLVNLLPLLIDHNEKTLRVLLPIIWLGIWEYCSEIDSIFDKGITTLGTSLVIFQQLVDPFIHTAKLAFLPLMLNSVFSATFNLIWLTLLYYQTLTLPKDDQQTRQTDQSYLPVSTSQQ